MPAWSVELEIWCEASLPHEEAVDELVDHLAAFAPAVAVGPRGIAIRVTVDNADHASSVTEATSAITEALHSVDLPAGPVVRAEALSDAALNEELETANRPTLVGVAEIAERLGVSRQRVSELARSSGFPAPIAELAAGPVWSETSLLRFIEGWERRPGRPRTVA